VRFLNLRKRRPSSFARGVLFDSRTQRPVDPRAQVFLLPRYPSTQGQSGLLRATFLLYSYRALLGLGPDRSTRPCERSRCRANMAHKTVKARVWPWLLGTSPENLSRCSLFTRKRTEPTTSIYRGVTRNEGHAPPLGRPSAHSPLAGTYRDTSPKRTYHAGGSVGRRALELHATRTEVIPVRRCLSSISNNALRGYLGSTNPARKDL